MRDRALEIVSMNDPAEYGLEPGILSVGDKIIEVMGQPAEDQLDFHFHTDNAEDTVTILVERKDGKRETIQVPTEAVSGLELWFQAMDFRRCRCKCPFCFVDQMPKGMRQTLYVKDEDFRLSFLYGNFTTMNDMTDGQIQKIIEQKNSPQWVSVHVVDETMRRFIFGRPMKRRILETLKTLCEGGIVVNTQAVIVPGKNDGDYLRETIEALESLHPNVATMAVVPVGLTKHRDGLPGIRSYRDDEMGEVIDLIEPYRKKFKAGARGSFFVFPSDEWFVGANREAPHYDDYEGFPQLDNGIGVIRQLLYDVETDIEAMGVPRDLGWARIVTGELGAKVFERYVLPLLTQKGVEVLPRITTVTNQFFGATVTCSGLLVGKDMVDAIRMDRVTQPPQREMVSFLPPNAFNHDDVTIDELSLERMTDDLGELVVNPGESLIESLHEHAGGQGVSA